ncbi:MAG: DNRLRE domain-containing protein [Crocinitomicaceae bacterium]|nr:DNRLRE domain-containing protein [Crocinitomicaceae bacterium]
MTSKFLIIASLILLGTKCVVAQETTVTFSPSLDTYVASEFPTTDNSTLDRTYSYYYGYSYRIFIDFDLSTIPDNAIVTSATLKMYCPWVNNAASHPYYLQRASSDWGGASKTWNNQPTVVTSDQLTITHTQTSSIGWHNFDVSNHAQYMINYPSLNYGWCMRLQSESGTTRGNKYWSQEYANSALRPILEVKYVIPIEISAKVKHCINSQNDGGIHSIDVTGGSSNYSSYEWFSITNGVFTSIETGTNINNADVANLSPGLYLLDVQDDLGYSGYQYFLVGEEGETTTVQIYATDLTKSQKYNEDAMTDDYPTYVNTNYGTYDNFYTFTNYYSAYQHYRKIRSLVKYKLDFSDFLLDYTSASYKTTCRSTGHYRGSSTVSNESFVSRVTSDWEEQIVTANSHPTITTTNQVNIPETNPTGYVFRDDNIDILNFVQYWQSNPSENYGFELALNSFTEVPWVRLIYGSSDVSTLSERPIFELSFDVKPSVTASWDETEELGSITVNAPNGELPYTYLIGYEPIPDLNELWPNVRDSVSMDSTEFFGGKVNSQNYVFDGYNAEHYFIAVYDNNGTKLADYETILGPDISLIESSNITATSNRMLRTTDGLNPGYCSIDGILEKHQTGGLEFDLGAFPDDFSIGLNRGGDTIVYNDSLYEYGLRFSSSSASYTVISEGNVLFTGPAAANDVFEIYKENYTLIYLKNGTEVYRNPIEAKNLDDYKFDVLLKGPISIVQSLSQVSKYDNKFRPVQVFPYDTECDMANGSVRLTPAGNGFFSTPSVDYEITDVSTLTVVASGTIAGSYVTIPLSVGAYQVTFTWTGGTWSELFTIGNTLQWNLLNNNLTPISNGLITSSFLSSAGYAESQNVLLAGQEGWVSFKSEPKDPAPFVTAPQYLKVSLKNTSGTDVVKVKVTTPGSGLITRIVEVYDDQGNLAAPSITSNSNGPILINRLNGSPNYFEVFIGTNPSPIATVNETATSDYEVYCDMLRWKIYDTDVSFCTGLTTSDQCAHLDYELDGNYYVTNNGKFCFVYNEEYNDPNIEFNIYNQNGDIVATEANFLLQSLFHGENRVVLDFTDNGICIGPGFFILEVINDKNEKFYLRFYNDHSLCATAPYIDDITNPSN